MTTVHRFRARPGLLILAALLLPLAPPPEGGSEARAEVPGGDPVFSDPLLLDNDWFPVVPGTMKVYRGRERGLSITVVEAHLEDLRVFPWNGLEVPCRTVRETVFVDGFLIETTRAWYAQADDGTVWAFGEANFPGMEPEPEEPDEDDHSWVVGAATGQDPENTISVPAPTVFMPANPAVGDVWYPDAGDPTTDEIDEARSLSRRQRVPAGLFLGCLEVAETSPEDRSRSLKWYAPGTGVVATRSRSERVRLQATTLGQPARPPRRPLKR